MEKEFEADTSQVETKNEIKTGEATENNITNQLEVSINDMNPE